VCAPDLDVELLPHVLQEVLELLLLVVAQQKDLLHALDSVRVRGSRMDHQHHFKICSSLAQGTQISLANLWTPKHTWGLRVLGGGEGRGGKGTRSRP
jgi:hypothetical protein